MAKHLWKESMKSFTSHLDPEKDDQLKWIKIEIENKVRRSLTLIKSVNQGNRDGNSKKKSELIQLVEDFHKEYQSLYALYENLKGEVRKKVHSREEDSSSSFSTASSDSESFYSPDEVGSKNSESKDELQKVKYSYNQKLETSDSEDAVLKDKLTSSSVVKETLNLGSVSSLGRVQESGEIIKDLRIDAEETDNTRQKFIVESAWLTDKLNEKEEILSSLTKNEAKASVQIKELEIEVASLKVQLETLCTQKRELEEQIVCKATEAKQQLEENLGLQTQIAELENTSRGKEDELSALLTKFEENEKHSMSTIQSLMVQAKNLQLEVDSLCASKCELEERLLSETKKGSAQDKCLRDQVNDLQQELESLSRQKSELELQLKTKSQEVLECVCEAKNLKEKLARKSVDEQETLEEKEGFRMQVKDLESEVTSLCGQQSDLEEQMLIINHNVDQSRVEKEALHATISELERTLVGRTDEVAALQKKINVHEDDMSPQIISLIAQVNSLQQEVDLLQSEKSQLQLQLERQQKESSQSLTRIEKQKIKSTNKIADQHSIAKEIEGVTDKLNQEHRQTKGKFIDSKSTLQIAEKKMEDMAEDFRKKFEDNLRILSRRIRVAEQLHAENKDWYRKTKENYEQEYRDLKERLTANEIAVRKIKDISLTANEMLTALDTVALKFEECSANFPNRISKVFCEVMFAKDWVTRKNQEIKHVKEDSDCLLVQLDDKEAEILVFREKVWKLEYKVRELEKMAKEKDEVMLGLKEEKREAIRQLCVWIDYHRSRSDFYKKMITEMNARTRSQRTP
ncbi:unnamed protein product [Ilex paraguariensis]|uniref:NAB domain-containing protein n=1 Tax=Ilex paraguariensis TaxID=185542 RepID=A0ABC8REZ1_9AQUA